MAFRLFTLLAVIALAISTWILSSPAHRPKASSGAAATDMPGYYLKNAVLTDFAADGTPSIHLQADRIDQIDHSSDVALAVVRVDYQAPGGQNWTLTGDTARVEAAGQVIKVSGNVRLQGDATGSSGAAVVHADDLSYDVPDAVATTKNDVRIDFGAHTLTGRGMAANLKERTVRLESKVNGRFQR